jgi:competence protein ComEC
MRIGFTTRNGDPALPLLHAGDRVSIFAEAHQPLVYKDPGAFDRRDFLARQGIHLFATLRSTKLLEKTGESRGGLKWRIARLRGFLRNQTDATFARQPGTAAFLRAILLGDRSFVDRAESVDFQKTGTFHVLVVAGLHLGALAIFLY